MKYKNGRLALKTGGVALLAKIEEVTADASVPFSSTRIFVLCKIDETK